MTFHPDIKEKEEYCLMGNNNLDVFLLNGIDGYVSMCGHTSTDTVMWGKDLYLDRPQKSIWRNNKGNVYLLDCGCGFGSGKLAGICIETGERFYSQKEQ